MPKTVSPSKFSEWQGLDRIGSIVHGMRCIWREISKDDFGIDGEIEVVAPKEDGPGMETTGSIIKVQSKSGASYIKQDAPDRFVTPTERNDLLTWNTSNVPIIFIVYHPGDDRLYWKDVKAYVRATPSVWQSPLHIAFDKTTDVFDTRAYEAICQLASISPPRVSFEQRERLYANLFLAKRAPRVLTHAPTLYPSHKAIRDQIQGFVPPFCVTGGRLYTLGDLRTAECRLRDCCDTSAIRDLQVAEWLKDEQRRPDYVFLLNQLLRQHAHRCGLKYNKAFDRYYFPRRDNTGLEFTHEWTNVRTGRAVPSRTVVKYFHYGADRYWRHLAAEMEMKFVGLSLFLQLIPKYLYTVDGETPCDRTRVGSYTTKQKALERNIHVLNHVLFFADILAQRTSTIEMQLNYSTILQLEKEPFSGVADFANPSDPAIYDEPTPMETLPLFDQLFAEPEGDGRDEY